MTLIAQINAYLNSPTPITLEPLTAASAQALYEAYIALKRGEHKTEKFYQEGLEATQQCSAAKLLWVIYNKNDLQIIEQLLREEAFYAVELAVLQMFMTAEQLKQAGNLFDVLISRSKKDPTFALEFVARFPECIPNFEKDLLKKIYTQLIGIQGATIRVREPTLINKFKQHVKIEDEAPMQISSSNTSIQAMDTVDNLSTRLSTTLNAYQQRINFLGLRKSKISRAIFTELREFLIENSPEALDKLNKQCELLYILDSYMKANTPKALSRALSPIYQELKANLGFAYSDYINKNREQVYKNRLIRIVSAYTKDPRYFKSVASIQMAARLQSLLVPVVPVPVTEPSATTCRTALAQYNQVTSIGQTLKLSLDPVIADIRTFVSPAA